MQEIVMRKAYKDAGLEVSGTDYVECHGEWPSGTFLTLFVLLAEANLSLFVYPKMYILRHVQSFVCLCNMLHFPVEPKLTPRVA